MKAILLMSEHCPFCPQAVEFLDKNNINYEKMDITESMMNLKEYLHLRDFHPAYQDLKKDNYVGIPALYIKEKDMVIHDIYDMDSSLIELLQK